MNEPMLLEFPPELEIELPPTEDQLPSSDGVPMESQRHVLQSTILKDPLLFAWKDRFDFFVGINMFVYFNLNQVRNRDFRGPDFFVVLGVPRREHKSWVVWEEGKGPDVVIELLSESTAAQDKGEKKLVYQDQLRVPEYFWFDPFSAEWEGWALTNGVYVRREPDEADRLISHQLGLALVQWEGDYQGVQARWLRWATLDGTLLPTPEEAAIAAQDQAQAAQRQAEAAQHQAQAAQQRAAEMEALLARYRAQFGDLAENDAEA